MGDKDSGNNFLLGFILGAVAGIAVGFLYAPKAGKETRAMLKEKAGEIKEKAEDVISRIKDREKG